LGVVERLAWDSRIDESKIAVEVHDGTVILRGLVPAYSQRSLAEDNAFQVEGVVTVDNQLTVDFPAAQGIPTDGEISANIINALSWDPAIDATSIHVAVRASVVTLKGTVASYWQKHRAGEIAEHMAGVSGVQNELKVKPDGQLMADEDIRTHIQAAIDRTLTPEQGQVRVDVSNGVVTLTGTVRDRVVRRTAEDLAVFTEGVLGIRNELKTK
jgi:osmotically-inducible protein OsmY